MPYDLGTVGSHFSDHPAVGLRGLWGSMFPAIEVTAFNRDDSLPRRLVQPERGNADSTL